MAEQIDILLLLLHSEQAGFAGYKAIFYKSPVSASLFHNKAYAATLRYDGPIYNIWHLTTL